MLLLCVLFDDSISMGLVSSSSVWSSGTSTPREARLLWAQGLEAKQGPGKWEKSSWKKWRGAPRNHYTSIQMGGAWRAVLGKVHLRECWRKAGLWNAYSHMPDDDEPVPGGHRWRQSWHQWSHQLLHQASSVGSEESWWFLHLLAGEGIVVPPLYIMGQANAPATTNAQSKIVFDPCQFFQCWDVGVEPRPECIRSILCSYVVVM